MGKLRDLAEKYGCDKLYAHSYIPFYEELLAYRNVRKVLEIGIGYEELMAPFVPKYVHGASLLMWEEFWPEAKIYGCDIRSDVLNIKKPTDESWEKLAEPSRIQTFLCDQADPHELLHMVDRIGGNLDFIIDDGSHFTEHQILSARVLLPHLSTSGVYVIEDVQEVKKVVEELEEVGRHVYAVTSDKRVDDNLVVIKKRK